MVGKYTSIETAKTVLGGISSGSRLVAEVDSSNILQRDPHTVGGQKQSQGSAAGFNKYWLSWPDINNLMNIAQSYLNSPTGMQKN